MAKADCPLWKAPCKEHQCRWYIQVLGKNPNTGEDVNRWDCAISWLPMLLIENSQQQRMTHKELNHLRNEVVVSNAQTRDSLIDQLRLSTREQLLPKLESSGH